MQAIGTLAQNTTALPQTEERSLGITVAFLIFYIVVVTCALIGNSLVLLSVYRYPPMRTVVNLFLANLATSDLLFALISLFDTVAYMKGGWYAGVGSCKVQSYLIEVFYTCSILTLVAVSFERYLAICRPHLKSRSRKQTLVVIAITWATSFGFCSVLLYAYRIRMVDSKPVCENLQWSYSDRRAFYTVHSVVVYLIPLTIMIWAHHRISAIIAAHKVPGNNLGSQATHGNEVNKNKAGHSSEDGPSAEEKQVVFETPKENTGTKLRRVLSRRKTGSRYKSIRSRKKVIKILITVTMTFFLLWTPFILIRMLLYYGLPVHAFIWRGTQLLILSSTAVNGLIYAYMSPQFRRCFKNMLPCFRSGDGPSENTSRAKEMNSVSNSASAPTENVKTRSLTRSFHIASSCM